VLWIIGLIGFLGISGMTWLCPTAGAVWTTVARRNNSRREARTEEIAPPRKVVIAIPAFNEAQTLPRTLASIACAMDELLAREPFVQMSLIVGDDGSSDRTATVAAEHGARVISVERSEGKWRMLHRLVDAASGADAIVFADAGIEWPREVLLRLMKAAAPIDVIGVAPGYRIGNSGVISRALWWVERTLKSIENRSGGPVSVHGATVMYRLSSLREALSKLSSAEFLNDDVIIPLTLRRLFPQARLVYLPDLVVVDKADPGVSERRRRSRLMRGNLQWLRREERGDTLTELIVARRVFRLFWVYWAIALFVPVFGAVMVATRPLGIATLGAGLGAFLLPWKPKPIERFLDAALASFRAPVELLRVSRRGTTSSRGTSWR